MSIESYRSLLVWRKSVDFVVLVYQLLGSFPKKEQNVKYRKLNPSGYPPFATCYKLPATS
jgi:hypothetical protein